MGKRKIWLLIAQGVSAANSGRTVSFYSNYPALPAKRISHDSAFSEREVVAGT